MKKFEALQLFEINLENFEKYLAHLPDKSLREHIRNTRAAFLALCKDGLEPIIDSQIMECFQGNHEIVKELILNLICLHDLGKLNPAFQKIKLNNEVDPSWDDENTRHSELGWHLFLLAYGTRIENSITKDEDLLSALALTTVIAGHHTYAWGSVDEPHRPTEEKLEFARKVVHSCGWKMNITQTDKNRVINQIIELPKDHPALFALYKTVYSSLILSDSIATGARNASDISSMSSVEKSDIKRWREAFDLSPHMRNLYQRRAKLEKQVTKDLSNINDLRNKILLETSKNMLQGLREGKRIFYLEAPTGSGKTNCATNLALLVLENDSTIKRLFFVFPFVNLIEQNIEVIRKSISARSDDILEVHSLAEWKTSEEYATEYDQRLFLDGKITVISSVTLFEALGSSRKAQNYKICNLSNSVIVLDEIQSIDDRKWTYLTFLLETFAKLNNCYFILMSATLPRIDRLRLTESDCDFVELLPDFEEYQKHPCFAKRAEITVNENINTEEELVHLVKEILSEVSEPTKLLIVVNTIRRSREVYRALPDSFETATGPRKFEKKLLNSELLPHIKRKVIQTAKEKRGSDLILVSTQCIEAGVDADFDVGIRDFAVLDSIEQVAGRVNRENENNESGTLHVVHLSRNDKKDAENVYKGGRRWKVCNILESDIANILKSRNYSTYYEKLVEINKKKNELPVGIDVKGRTETRDAVSLRLHSEKIKKFRAIEDNRKKSYFIMVDIPKSEFSLDETKQIEFAIENDMIKAEKVWGEYLRLKELRGREGMIKMAAFSPILSKFIASKHSEDFMDKPLELLRNFEGIYDLDSGFLGSDNIF